MDAGESDGNDYPMSVTSSKFLIRRRCSGAGVDGSNGEPELGIAPTGSGRPGLWRSSGLVDQQCILKACPGTTLKRRGVPQVAGADIGEEVIMQCVHCITGQIKSSR